MAASPSSRFKASLGKLSAPRDLLATLEDEDFISLSLTSAHAARLQDLPWHHRDPFDRVLIAQASVEDLTMITVDPAFAAYEIHTLPI